MLTKLDVSHLGTARLTMSQNMQRTLSHTGVDILIHCIREQISSHLVGLSNVYSGQLIIHLIYAKTKEGGSSSIYYKLHRWQGIYFVSVRYV